MKTKTIALLAASAIALAACSNKAEEAPVAETNVSDIVESPLNVSNEAIETPVVEPVTNVATTAAPPSATLTADEQTVEDADATGMTAKVNRDEASDTAQPAQ